VTHSESWFRFSAPKHGAGFQPRASSALEVSAHREAYQSVIVKRERERWQRKCRTCNLSAYKRLLKRLSHIRR